jgi:RNA polymerase sigma factor (sigma-70 family)
VVASLYERHSRMVFRRARELLRDDDAAEDATQEVFMRVIRAGGDVPSEPTPTAWLYRVVSNLCLNRLRDQQRRAALLAEHHAQPGVVPPFGEDRVVVASILREVPAEIQEAAVYFFVDEMTYDEIARVTGASRRTVGNRLAAFRDLMNALAAETGLVRVA